MALKKITQHGPTGKMENLGLVREPGQGYSGLGLTLWDAVKLGCCELCHQLKAPQYIGWVAGSPLSQLPSSWSMYVTGLG